MLCCAALLLPLGRAPVQLRGLFFLFYWVFSSDFNDLTMMIIVIISGYLVTLSGLRLWGPLLWHHHLFLLM